MGLWQRYYVIGRVKGGAENGEEFVGGGGMRRVDDI